MPATLPRRLSSADTEIGNAPIVDIGVYKYFTLVSTPLADYAADGDIDMDDFKLLQQTFTGPLPEREQPESSRPPFCGDEALPALIASRGQLRPRPHSD